MRRNKEQSEWGLPHEDMRLCFKRKEPAEPTGLLAGGRPDPPKTNKKGHSKVSFVLERIMSLVKKTLDKRF